MVQDKKIGTLVFSKHDKKKVRRTKKSGSKKTIYLIGFLLLCFISIILGYLFAKSTPIPLKIGKSSASKVIEKPFVQEVDPVKILGGLLAKNDIEYSEILPSTTSATFTITLQKEQYAYVTSSKNLEEQIVTLGKILQRRRIENPTQKISYIDLRFEKPVVKVK